VPASEFMKFPAFHLSSYTLTLFFDLCSTWTDDDKTQMGRRLSAVCYGLPLLNCTSMQSRYITVHANAERDGKGTDRQYADSSDPTYSVVLYTPAPHMHPRDREQAFSSSPSSSLRYKIASTPVQTERIKGVEGVKTTKEGVKGNSFSNLVIGTSETW
jgi:hypothetical protein